MKPLWTFFFVTIAFCARKYKSDKINYVYDKVQHHIQDRQLLAKLEKDLSTYDDVYMDTKNQHGSAPAGTLNKELAGVDKKLIILLDKYGLDATVQAFKEKTKAKEDWRYDENINEVPSETFVDDRLQDLWQKAHVGKFSDIELIEIHRELKEVEKKMKVYDDQLDEFQKAPHENTLHHDDDLMKDQLKKLKIANKALNENLEEVYKKVTSEDYSLFSEDKVKKLWKLAKDNKKFTAHELSILKEELSHFENQLKKFDFHKNEVEKMKSIDDDAGKSHSYSKDATELETRHEKLEKKNRKLEKYLVSKITHSEL